MSARRSADAERREWRGTWRLVASLLAGFVVVVTVVVMLARPDGRIEGVVTRGGVPVPGARVVAMVSMTNVGSTFFFPFVRPREVLVRADAEGRYVIEHARTDVVLALVALPPTGKGGMMMVDVEAVPGETVHMDLSLAVRSR